MLMRQVKVFGERNTSTNALKQLIEKNSDAKVVRCAEARTLNRTVLSMAKHLRLSSAVRSRYLNISYSLTPEKYSWKHCATKFRNVDFFKGALTVICVRHPVSWLWALYHRPNEPIRQAPTFSEFLQKSWQTTNRDRLGSVALRPYEIYNLKISSYLQFIGQLREANCSFLVVRFEDFANDQLTVFEKLSPLLAGAHPRPTAIESSTKDSGKTRDYYREYYGNNRWLDEMSPIDVVSANEVVDWRLMGEFGYSPLMMKHKKESSCSGLFP